jgi:hypothetical protein
MRVEAIKVKEGFTKNAFTPPTIARKLAGNRSW